MIWPRLFLLFLTLSGVSCQHKFSGSESETLRDDAILRSRRAASMDVWKDKTIKGFTPSAYAPLATAMVLPPDAKVKLQQTKVDGNTTKLVLKAKGKDLSAGSAVPITGDGYFLTAAHNTDDFSHVLLAVPLKSKTFGVARARVVWRSAPAGKGADIALLHAPLLPFAPLTMAAPDTLLTGMPVLICGYSGNNPTPAGGKILSLSEPATDASGAVWQQIRHSAPVNGGDSGGAIIGPEGQLLGITTSIHYRFVYPFGIKRHWAYKGLAAALDPEWIQALINKDRARRKSKRPT
ncbi:MAG: serine protease [Verrucomicrobiota bacterium]